MAWPTPQDYNEAVQSPRLNFDDPDLKSGSPDVTPLGLPRPITGGFASVYSIRAGSRRWAVRCFLRDFADHKERYQEIGRHLASAQLPYTVDFRFLEKGIRVRGHWYPVLKMEWIDGATFHEVIESNIQNPVTLTNLAERWLKMLSALKRHGIAHGDLQHGNVLIAGGDFRLIDYDGIFVPAFAGRTSHEVGHRNYQHPARTEKDFAPHIDSFSGWVIYLTLISLSVDASLWGRYGGGLEHLLFQKDDFDQPRYSRLIRSLQNLRDDRIQKYLALFESFLTMRLEAVVSPSDVAGVPRKRTLRQIALPSWSRQHQLELFGPKPKPKPKPDVPLPPPLPDSPAAIPDKPPVAVAEEPASEQGPIALLRIGDQRPLTGCYGIFIAALIGLSLRGNLPGTRALAFSVVGFMSVISCFACSYLALSPVREKLVLRLRIRLLSWRCSAIQFAVHQLESWRTALELGKSRVTERFDGRDAASKKHHQARIEMVQATFRARVAELNSWREELAQTEAAEVAEALQQLQSARERVLSEAAILSVARADELGRYEQKTLKKWQNVIDDLVESGPPRTIPVEMQAKIQIPFNAERRRMRQSQLIAAKTARRKIGVIRRARDQERRSLVMKRGAAISKLETRQELLKGFIDRGQVWIQAQNDEIDRNGFELERYCDIRFSRYLLSIFGIL